MDDTFELRFEVNGFRFRVQCIVRHSGPDHRLGVEILAISQRGRAQLLELLGELDTTRHTPQQVR
jgi:hypothetical protein